MLQLLSIALALVASITWGVAPILYRINLTESIFNDFLSISLGALTFAIPLIFLRPSLNGYAWIYGALFALLGPVLGTYMYLLSLRYINVGIATVIAYSDTVILPLFMLIFNLSYIVYVGPAVLIIIGLYLLMGSGGGKVYGYLMALLSAILYATSYLALYKAFNYTSPWGIIFIGGIVLMMSSLFLKIMFEGSKVKLNIRIFLTGLISYGVGALSYVYSAYHVGVVVPTLITSLSPLITEVLAVTRLRERLNLRMAIGFTMVMMGIIMVFLI